MAETTGDLHAARCGLEVLNGFLTRMDLGDLSVSEEDFKVGRFVLYEKMVQEIRVAEKTQE